MKEQQAVLFLWFVCLGIGCRLTYDGLRAIRKEIKHAAIFVMLEDILFCAAACGGCYGLFFAGNNGALRAYGFIGILLGVALYDLTIGRWMLKVLSTGLKIILTPIHWVLSKCKKWKFRRKALTNRNR